MGDTTFTAQEIAEVVECIRVIAYTKGYNKALKDANGLVTRYYENARENYGDDDGYTTALLEIINHLKSWLKSEAGPSSAP